MKNKNNKDSFSLIKRASPYFFVILFFAAILPYISGLKGEFVFDDIGLIKEDPFYVNESNPLQCWNRSFWKIDKTQGMYRPLTLFSYWVETRIYSPFSDSRDGLFSPGFRFTNLILHILTVLLVFKFAERLRFGRITSFVAAMIFAVHPIHVEAVTPAFGRGELLCALFLVAGLVLHTYREKSQWYSIFAVICFILSFMAKEHGVIFLPAIFIIDWFTGKIKITDLREKSHIKIQGFIFSLKSYLIYLIPVVVVFGLRWWRLGSLLPEQQFFDPFIDNNIARAPWYIMFVSAIRIHGLALYKFIFPSVLSCDYSYSRLLPSANVFDPYAWLTLLLFFGIPAVFIYFFPKNKKKVLMLLCIYVISILPAGNFIVPAGTIFAERLQYIPSICLVLFSAMLFIRISRYFTGNMSMILFSVLIFVLSLRTVYRTLDWKDGLSLWSSTVLTTPQSCKAWVNYATSIGQVKSEGDTRDYYIEAVNACSEAIRIHPKYASAYANRGYFLARLELLDPAEADLRKAVELSSMHKWANYHLGVVLAHKGKITEARKIWLWLAKRHPNDKLIKNALEQSAKDLSNKQKEVKTPESK
jgi:hypothetical protein